MEGRPPASLVFAQMLWYSCSRSAESVTSCLKKKANSYARGFRIPSGKGRESFCQRSVNLRNTCLIGSHSQSIPNERRSCDALPSKQAVAGLHPKYRLLGLSVGGRRGPLVPSFALLYYSRT